MDRNLGATNNDLSTAAYGLLYQWGRKDPFRNSSDPTFIESSSTTGNIIYTIKNPVTFLYTVGSRTQNDWHYSSRDNTLWNETKDGKDIKTIYDPCPAGWRVPAYKDNIADKAHSPWMEYDNDNYTTELAGLARETTGYKFTHKNNYEAYYPRAGYRANGSGNFSSSNGRYWSASPYDSRIAYLYVAGYIDAADNFYGRACGHSVRCARE
jgi:uncharacterized protein (TIGR02145 family)